MWKKTWKNKSSNQLVNEARLTWWVLLQALARNRHCSHHHYCLDTADKEPGSQAAFKSGGKEPHHSGGVPAAVTAWQVATATALPTCLHFWEGNNNQLGRGCGSSSCSCPAHQAATVACSSKLVEFFKGKTIINSGRQHWCGSSCHSTTSSDSNCSSKPV